MVIIMKTKNKVAFLSLLTGAIVCSSYGTDVLNSNFSLCALYDVSSSTIADGDSLIQMSDVKIPIVDEMVPQGLCYTGEYFLISSYDYSKNSNSCVYTLNSDGSIVNTAYLDNKSHVGGLSYDNENNLVWVASLDGCVSAFDFDSILHNSNVFPKYSDVDVGSGLINYRNPFLNSISFLSVYNNHLFVGNFSLNGLGFIKEYDISIDSNTRVLTLGYVRKFSIPDKVQGVTFYNVDGLDYIIFSRSFGKNMPSILQIYKYDENILDYNDPSLKYVTIEAPNMIEQTTVINDSLYSIYESCALPYKNNNIDLMANLSITDLDTAVKNLKR